MTCLSGRDLSGSVGMAVAVETADCDAVLSPRSDVDDQSRRRRFMAAVAVGIVSME